MQYNVLVIYDSTQSYTDAVYDDIKAFSDYSAHLVYYLDFRYIASIEDFLPFFNFLIVHYSVRLPYDLLSGNLAYAVKRFKGVKALFIQDEYNKTSTSIYWIDELCFDVVFTCVPEASVDFVYPINRFLKRPVFVSGLTGYVSDRILSYSSILTKKQRPITIGYRGRALPLYYGDLGSQKTILPNIIKKYCIQRKISEDISCNDSDRLYGESWFGFLGKCRAMIGTESGSNLFDDDSSFESELAFGSWFSTINDSNSIYNEIFSNRERNGLMNQISPRVFEMISARTLMVLVEGSYSNILIPYRHYLPLKKDLSNIDTIFEMLADDDLVDRITNCAQIEIIQSSLYHYKNRVSKIFEILVKHLQTPVMVNDPSIMIRSEPNITAIPLRAPVPCPRSIQAVSPKFVLRLMYKIWPKLPLKVRFMIKKFVHIILSHS